MGNRHLEGLSVIHPETSPYLHVERVENSNSTEYRLVPSLKLPELSYSNIVATDGVFDHFDQRYSENDFERLVIPLI